MIGFFDSGYGGLSILKHVVRTLPEYSYVYLGDNARTPYGGRSSETVCAYTEQAVSFLEGRGCTLIILACNTSSAEALRIIQQRLLAEGSATKVLGVIVPAVEAAVEATRSRRIGIIATEGTVASGTFVREIKNRVPDAEVFQQPAPLLVPYIEAGEHQSPQALKALQGYLDPLLAHSIDTLILGCTHYAHMEDQVHSIVGGGVTVISEGPVVAEKLAQYLQKHDEVESRLERGGGVHFCTTDSSDRFQQLGTFFYGSPISPESVSITG